MRKIPILVLSLAGLCSTPVRAEAPADALANQWNTICATAINGTLLFLRCDETFNSTDPLANLIAATGQRLNEIPGQARIATRDFSDLQSSVSTDVAGHVLTLLFGQRNNGSMSLQLQDDLAARWSLFFSADVGQVQRRLGTNEAAFDAGTAALTAGADWQPSTQWLFGMAINHTQENLDFDHSDSTADTRFTGVIITSSHPFGERWGLDAYLGSQRGSYDLQRAISYELPLATGSVSVSGVAFANPDASRSVQGIAATGTWSRSGWDRILSIGFDGSKTRIDPYTETGGVGLALIVPGRTVSTMRARIDATLDCTVSRDWGVWQPLLRIGWRQEFRNDQRAVTLHLQQDPLQNPITFDTEDPDRGWGEFALGSVFTFTDGHSAFIEYRQRFAHDFLQERILALGWRIEL